MVGHSIVSFAFETTRAIKIIKKPEFIQLTGPATKTESIGFTITAIAQTTDQVAVGDVKADEFPVHAVVRRR